MASLNGFIGNLTGTTGASGSLAPASGWYVYVLERGAHAAAASSGSNILFDSAAAASRFAASDWIQVGTAVANIRQVSAVAGTSITVSSSVTVAQSDRILNCGTVQPVVASGLATYTPTTTIYPRDDDSATAVTASKLTTDSTGLYQFWASDNLFDLLGQDSNGANQFLLADVAVGLGAGGNLIPATTGIYDIGSSSLFWDDIFFDGSLISGKTSTVGVTVFHFYDATGVTSGNLFSFQLNTATLLYGDTYGGVKQSWTLGEVVNVKSARFGALGDAATNDSTAIQNAINYAATTSTDGNGGVVFFPPGVYLMNSQVTIPSRVVLRGCGDKTSVLRMGPSFSTAGVTSSRALVRIGSGSGDSYGRVELLQIDCNTVASSIGLYSSEGQENAGLRFCNVVRYADHGVVFEAGTVQNTLIENTTFMGAVAATTARSVKMKASSKNVIRNCTFNTYDGSTVLDKHVVADATNLSVEACNFEHAQTGIDYLANSTGRVTSNRFTATVVTPLAIRQAGVLVTDHAVSGTTKLIDTVAGISIVSAFNSGGWYMKSNDSSTLTSWQQGSNIINPQTIFGKTVTLDAQLGVTGLATFIGGLTVSTAAAVFNSALSLSGGVATTLVQAGTTLTLPTTNQGNIFGLSSTATAILGITPLTHGRMVILIGEKGSQTFTSGPSLEIDAANTLTSQDRMPFMCYGNTWYQFSPKGV